jgi:hypothetical protein
MAQTRNQHKADNGPQTSMSSGMPIWRNSAFALSRKEDDTMTGGDFPIDLVQRAIQMQMTRDQVIQVLIYRIERDQAYLERRKRQGQHTVFDTLTEADLLGLAMAVALLTESTPG